ncbi:hypothetical protein [Oryzifoliimicrobium ureilyticus]|uniref:hypothetical protein n=1 Tax=Oryzifoliimicrobium ureilyticus TaxID=3113724 RepID=UPI003076154F
MSSINNLVSGLLRAANEVQGTRSFDQIKMTNEQLSSSGIFVNNSDYPKMLLVMTI